MNIQVRSLLALIGLFYVLSTNLEVAAQTEPQFVWLEEEGFLEPGDLVLEEDGFLEPGDLVLEEDGSLYDEYFFEGTEDSLVTITLESTDFDTHLILFDPDGQILAKKDDIDSNTTNSRLRLFVPADGVYQLFVNGLDSDDQGRYTLVVTSARNFSSGGERPLPLDSGKNPASGASYNAARTLYQRGLSASRENDYILARSLLTSSANAFKALGRTLEEAQARAALRTLTR